MKKFHILLIALLVITTISSCKKKDDEEKLAPKQTQFGFAINYTAKWCGPCGSWGAPAIHSLHDVDGDKVIAITAHASRDPMHNRDLYYTFGAADQRPTGGGIPAFYVADTKTYSTSAMTSLLGRTPIAGMDMKSSKKDGKMKVDAQVKFFEAGYGEYYLSVLMLEDGIDGGNSASYDYQQNGTNDPDYKHDFVLRASHVQGNSYGELITTDPAKDKTFDISAEMDIDSDWDKVYPVLLLWHKNANGFYEFVNAFK
jgi:hypothetical protein